MTPMKFILKLLSIAFTIFYLLYSFIIAEHKTFGVRLLVAITWKKKKKKNVSIHVYW